VYASGGSSNGEAARSVERPWWQRLDDQVVHNDAEVMDQFLYSPEMMRLEKHCMRTFNLNTQQLEDVGKLSDAEAKSLLQWHEHVGEYLRQRQQCEERVRAKASLGLRIAQRMRLGGGSTPASSDGPEEPEAPSEHGSHASSPSHGQGSAGRMKRNAMLPATDQATTSVANHRRQHQAALNGQPSPRARSGVGSMLAVGGQGTPKTGDVQPVSPRSGRRASRPALRLQRAGTTSLEAGGARGSQKMSPRRMSRGLPAIGA